MDALSTSKKREIGEWLWKGITNMDINTILLVATIVMALVFLLTLGVGWLQKDEKKQSVWYGVSRVFFHLFLFGVFGMVFWFFLKR